MNEGRGRRHRRYTSLPICGPVTNYFYDLRDARVVPTCSLIGLPFIRKVAPVYQSTTDMKGMYLQDTYTIAHICSLSITADNNKTGTHFLLFRIYYDAVPILDRMSSNREMWQDSAWVSQRLAYTAASPSRASLKAAHWSTWCVRFQSGNGKRGNTPKNKKDVTSPSGPAVSLNAFAPKRSRTSDSRRSYRLWSSLEIRPRG